MLQLWGRLSSINVRKVVLCAQVLGLDLPRTDAGLAHGVVDTPGYRARNPNGLVPLLQDGDFTLWESNAIVRYLCARENRLYPSGLRQRFDAERWMDWQQTTLNPAGSPGFKQWIRTPAAQRNARSWPATASPWPTSPSPARCTGGGACRWNIPPIRTCAAGMKACGNAPPPAAPSTCP